MFDAVLSRFAAIPIMKTLGISIESLSVGEAVLRIPYRQSLDGVFESLHGGIMITVADTAACPAVLTQDGSDASVATTDMSIRFPGPCKTNCSAHARVIKFGRTLVPLEVSLTDTEGRLCAIAQVTHMRLGRRER